MKNAGLVLGLAGIALAGVALKPATTFAAPTCGNFSRIEKSLKERFNESRVAMGILSDGMTWFVLFGGPKGSFSLVTVGSSGVGCFVWGGHDLEVLKYVKGDAL